MSEEMVQAPEEVTDDDKLWALLSWIIWPLGAIALLMEDKKNRPFVKYNAVQSVALGLIAWASIIIGIGVCVGPLAFIYAIFLGFTAYKGELVTVPVITDLCKNQGWI